MVLMEIRRDQRRFLLADTGICVVPGLDDRIDILASAVEVCLNVVLLQTEGCTDGGDRNCESIDARDG